MLIKVEIENYMSLKDEQTIKFNKDVTTLIGKNEAGKSCVLSACEKLNGLEIDDTEKNVECRDRVTKIIGYFSLSLDDIKKINMKIIEIGNKTDVNQLPEDLSKLYFSISINEKGVKSYSLLELKENKYITISENFFLEKAINNVKSSIEHYIDVIDEDKLKEYHKLLNVKSKKDFNDIISTIIPGMMEELRQEIDCIVNEYNSAVWINYLPKYKFMKFSSFTDILQDSILVSEINGNIQVKNLLKIANIDADELVEAMENGNHSKLKSFESRVEFNLSNKFKNLYKQVDDDFKIEIYIDRQDKKITFLTKDKTSGLENIALSKRSDGFKWYLSMYLKLYDYIEGLTDNNVIFLIDEPNMYLHASAQKDLLENVFKKEFSGTQILYTTHSPYMIDVDNPFSIRIIEKDLRSQIFTQPDKYVLSKGCKDEDTMTPYLTTLGLHINSGLGFGNSNKIVLLEGIQDFYLINAFLKILDLSSEFKNIKFIPCLGASKMINVYSYLFGMGYDVYTIVDNDVGGIDFISSIKDDIDDANKHLLIYQNIENSKCVLEELFSNNDWNNYVKEKNTIMYKGFYDNCHLYKLDELTKSNFSKNISNIYSSIYGKELGSSNTKKTIKKVKTKTN